MRIRRRFLFGLLASTAAACVIPGCSGDPSKPKPVLHVMGAVQMDRTVPAGGPYDVAVVVALDDTPVTEAVVTVNGIPLAYRSDPEEPEYEGFKGVIHLAEGEPVTLSVSCSMGEKSAQAVTPGFVRVLTPEPGAAFDDSLDIPITWTPVEYATTSIVACGETIGWTAKTWLMQKDDNSYAVPASSTSPPEMRINVLAMNGEGAMPTSDLRQWIGQDGFWVWSQDWVDVLIDP